MTLRKSAGVAASDRIRGLRERLKMNQTDFAFALKTRPSTVSKWESGHNRPSPDVFVRLAKLADGMDKLFFLEEAGLPVAFLDGAPMVPEIRDASMRLVASALGSDNATFVADTGGNQMRKIPLITNVHDLGDPNAMAVHTLSFPSLWLPNDATIQAVKLSTEISPYISGELIALVDISRADPDRLLGCVVAAQTNKGIEPMMLRRDGGIYFLVPLRESEGGKVRVLRPRGEGSIVGKILKWIGDAPVPSNPPGEGCAPEVKPRARTRRSSEK